MRVLYLADIRFPLERANGIQSMETCHGLARRGHHVTMVVREDTHQPPRDPLAYYGLPPIDTLTIERAPASGPAAARRASYLSYALGRVAGRGRQDVIFTRDLGVASLVSRIPGSLRAPLIFESHGIAADVAEARPRLLTHAPAASESKLRRLRRRDERVWRAADGYVTITRRLAEELQRRFGSRTHVAHVADGASVPAAPPAAPEAPAQAPETEAQFTLGYAGHLYPWKGVELVIEVVHDLLDTGAIIVGGHDREPDLERLRAFATSLDCGLRITFTGMVPPVDVPGWLARADLLILPNPATAISTNFTSPLKLFEYMAANRAIVASDLPAIREVLTHERNALLFEPGNSAALTAAVQRLIADAPLRQQLAAQAFADVQDYSWDRRAERLEALFTQVAA